MKKQTLLIIFLIVLFLATIIIGNQYQEAQLKKILAKDHDYDEYLVDDDKQNLINMPKVIYNTLGQDTVIYYQNLLSKKINENYYLRNKGLSNVAPSDNVSFSFKSSEAGMESLELELIKDNKVIAVDKTNIVTNPMRTDPVKGLVLGDSTVITKGFGHVTQRLIDNLGDNIELVGTMGTAPNLYEGRGGWTAAKYRTNDEYQGVVNPFYNPDKAEFDFEYYMSKQGYTDLDFVIINLGINDTYTYKSDEDLTNDFDNIIKNYDFIIESIKSYDSDIRIGLNLTIPPSSNPEMFIGDYEDNQTLERAKMNNFLWIKLLLEHYSESENVDLVPIYLGIDTENNYEDRVHPNIDGYKQIGDQITSYLNSLK